MKNIIVLICFVIIGCENTKNSISTEAKTSYYPYAQNNIEKIDFSVQLKKEW